MDYRVATVYFYSGTGNSYRVAVWMKDALAEEGAKVTLRPIDALDPSGAIAEGPSSLFVLVMPTHGFTAPWAVLRFATGLPRRRGTHAVVVATRAGMKVRTLYTPGFEGTATLLVAAILALKGYRIRGTAGIDMPSNWLALHPGLSAAAVAGIVSRAKTTTARFMRAIISGKTRFRNWPVSLLGLLVLPISAAYLLLGRLFLAKLFFASDRCTGCGLCAEHCPNRAIEMRGAGKDARPYWTFRCESCMRCIGYCPEQAVEASHLLAVAVYLMARAIPISAALTWLAARVPVATALRRVPGWIVFWTINLALLATGYPLFQLLLKARPINWFLSRATLTRYYRRYHEPGTKLGDMKGP
jgi:formate hydrogenlyase subunit 6/NADH:ubiquinone oxidoreductase subunit I